MQIEQFDTGLKTKTNVKDIVISPEQNLQNKNLIRSYLNQIVNLGIKEIDKSLEKAFVNDVKVNCFYPLNEFTGLKNLKDKLWIPLLEAFPDLERREHIVLGGAFRDKILVGSYSTLSGYFKKTWLGIIPNLNMINLRCCEIHELKEDKIVETVINGSISLGKIGEFILNYSKDLPIFYGLTSVILAVGLGVGAAVIRNYFSKWNAAREAKLKAS